MHTFIYHIPIVTGSIPAEWKSANIMPVSVHKKGEKNHINNYRPISLTCITAAKIMEHIIQEELLNKTQNLVNSVHHGFLLGSSCDTNLITLTDDIASSLHNDTGIDIKYFDFAKAFDTVNHDLLLYKLKNCYKIDARLLKFIKNYLQNRCQRTSLENVFSNYLPVKSGVHPGSVLGPLLFVVFINDISNGVSPGTNICRRYKNLETYE